MFTLSWAPFGSRTFWVAAVASVVTMPLTAVWFLLFGTATIALAPLIAITRRSPSDRERTISGGISLGAGLLVGPLIYLGLALLPG